MNSSHARSVLAAAGLALSACAVAAPDVIVSDINSVANFTASGGIGGIRAYSFGTQFCNPGDSAASWRANTNQHALSVHNVFRLKDGRLEQIGLSWVAHEFFALQMGNICGFCPGGDGTNLQPGCATPTTANYTGIQSNLGRRSDVDASTGAFPFPQNSGTGDAIFKRVQIAESDIDPAALFFVEAVALHPDDAAADGPGAMNNASHRRIVFSPVGFAVTYTGAASVDSPAVFAWQDHGLGAGIADPGVHVTTVDIPAGGVPGAGGRFYVAMKATNIGFGRWHYEYAVENLNCDRSGEAFSVAMPGAVAAGLTNVGFHDINYHSGEVYDPTDWAALAGAGGVAWQSPHTFLEDPSSNALRWGTVYNFRFDAEGPPAAGDVTLGMFKHSAIDPNSFAVATFVPTTPCPGDTNLDRVVNFADLNLILSNFGHAGAPGTVAGDANDDGVVNFADLNLTLSNFGVGC